LSCGGQNISIIVIKTVKELNYKKVFILGKFVMGWCRNHSKLHKIFKKQSISWFMRTQIQIAPSLLGISDSNMLEAKVKELDTAGADLFHIDVMDGVFVPTRTLYLNPHVTRDIRQWTKKDLDVHLMVQNPAEHIGGFISAGADIVTIHAEADGDKIQLLQDIKQQHVRAGIALNPATEFDENIMAYCREADMILFMTVVPGKGGQGYIETVNEKIKTARRLFPDKDIQVDGGVKVENAHTAITAGANILVSGTGILLQKDYKKVMDKMREAILIGSDHAGYELKEAVKAWFVEQKKACIDVGTYTRDSCDYPVYAKKIAEAIQREDAHYGILICGTGQGMSMAANRFGVRAALVMNEDMASMATKHNDAHVLCLGAKYTTAEQAQKYITAWMAASYEGGRHQRRLDMF
jgi:ribulose-phosphate 3-epimerase